MNIASKIAGVPLIRRSVPGKEAARVRAYLVLALGDMLALAASFVGANLVMNPSPFALSHGGVMLVVLAPLYLAAAAANRAYSATVLESRRRSVLRAIRALLTASGAILLIAYLLKASGDFSRAVFAIGIMCSILSLAAIRAALFDMLLRSLDGSAYVTAVIVDGVDFTPSGQEVVFTSDELGFEPGTADPHQFHRLAQTVSEADRVVVACRSDRYRLWATILKSLTVDGEIFTEGEDDLGVIGMGRHAGRSTMVVTTGPLSLRDRAIKRAFDVAASLLGILVLSPVLLIAAAWIKLDSRGPVLFRQERIGRDNKIFRMYKFRSMYVDRCDAAADRLTTRGDSRVTRAGDFLRRNSVDELPQLLNVLRGDMSVVGPRPHPLSAKAADTLYWDVDVRYRHRHSIKPGLTGLAQVRGFRGNTERLEDLTNRLQADLEYAAEWSLSRDLQIILRTLLVFRHHNAY